jgi:phosphatidylglycerophosphate synthase
MDLPKSESDVKSEIKVEEDSSSKYKTKVLKTREAEYFFSHYIHRKISSQITKLIIKTPLSANDVTMVSLFIGFIAAYFFLQNSYLAWFAGAIVYQFFHIFDGVDGEVARYKKQCSSYGGYLDNLSHNLLNGLMFAAMGLGLFFTYGHFVLIFFAFIGAITVVLNQVVRVFLSNLHLMRQINFPDKPSIKPAPDARSSLFYAKVMKFKKLRGSDNFILQIIKGFLTFGALGYVLMILMTLEIYLPIPFKYSLREMFFMLICVWSGIIFVNSYLGFWRLRKDSKFVHESSHHKDKQL